MTRLAPKAASARCPSRATGRAGLVTGLAEPPSRDEPPSPTGAPVAANGPKVASDAPAVGRPAADAHESTVAPTAASAGDEPEAAETAVVVDQPCDQPSSSRPFHVAIS